MCAVFLNDEDRVINLACEQLEPVTPMCQDHVMIIAGEYRQATGRLVSIDNFDAVVKLQSEELKMVPLKYLCTLQM